MTQQETRGSPSGGSSTAARNLTGVALVRIATGGGSDGDIAKDLQAFASDPAAPEAWRIELGRLIAALTAGGLVENTGVEMRATALGLSAAAEFLGLRKGLPASWNAARDGALTAKALGLDAAQPRRLKLLAKPDGVRAMIVVQAFGLKIKGAPTPSRLRSALAVKALERAFGNQIRSGMRDKSDLPAKAGRLLAGQLSTSGRDFGTDARLIAALAAEAVGATKSDLRSLQVAVLRKFVGRAEKAEQKSRSRRRASSRRKAGPSVPRPANCMPVPAVQGEIAPLPTVGVTSDAGPAFAPLARPDPEGFAQAVLAATAATAEGWSGDRKAFISKVWAELLQSHPEWALSEIEFKCMLTEAHRTGLLTLVNADLKDKLALKEIQQSAVVYKNTVWHYVRAAH